MEAVSILTSLAEEHRYLGYLVLFFGMILEGELILMTAGILANIGALDLGDTFLIAFAGVMINDIIWYGIGVQLKKRCYEGSFIKKIEAKVRVFLPHIEKNPIKAIFISKFIAGINHPTLLLFGFLRINFFFFLRHQLWASFLWTLTFFSLGIFFGYTAISYSQRFKEFVFIAVLLLIIAMLVERIIRLSVQKRKNSCAD